MPASSQGPASVRSVRSSAQSDRTGRINNGQNSTTQADSSPGSRRSSKGSLDVEQSKSKGGKKRKNRAMTFEEDTAPKAVYLCLEDSTVAGNLDLETVEHVGSQAVNLSEQAFFVGDTNMLPLSQILAYFQITEIKGLVKKSLYEGNKFRPKDIIEPSAPDPTDFTSGFVLRNLEPGETYIILTDFRLWSIVQRAWRGFTRSLAAEEREDDIEEVEARPKGVFVSTQETKARAKNYLFNKRVEGDVHEEAPVYQIGTSRPKPRPRFANVVSAVMEKKKEGEVAEGGASDGEASVAAKSKETASEPVDDSLHLLVASMHEKARALEEERKKAERKEEAKLRRKKMKLRGMEGLSEDEDKRSEAGSSVAVQSAPKWVDDDTVQFCAECEAEFGLIVRRHHCRACGMIFCNSCTSRTMELPEFGMPAPVRVCNRCFDRRTEAAKKASVEEEFSESDGEWDFTAGPMPVEIQIEARWLKSCVFEWNEEDAGRGMYVRVVVYERQSQGGQYKVVGNTETDKYSRSLRFKQRIETMYRPDEVRHFIFSIEVQVVGLDKKFRPLEQVAMPLSDLVATGRTVKPLGLKSKRPTDGTGAMLVVSVRPYDEIVSFQYSAYDLPTVSGMFEKPNPFLVLYRVADETETPDFTTPGGVRWKSIHTSEIMYEDVEPSWDPFTVPMWELCRRDQYKPLRIAVKSAPPLPDEGAEETAEPAPPVELGFVESPLYYMLNRKSPEYSIVSPFGLDDVGTMVQKKCQVIRRQIGHEKKSKDKDDALPLEGGATADAALELLQKLSKSREETVEAAFDPRELNAAEMMEVLLEGGRRQETTKADMSSDFYAMDGVKRMDFGNEEMTLSVQASGLKNFHPMLLPLDEDDDISASETVGSESEARTKQHRSLYKPPQLYLEVSHPETGSVRGPVCVVGEGGYHSEAKFGMDDPITVAVHGNPYETITVTLRQIIPGSVPKDEVEAFLRDGVKPPSSAPTELTPSEKPDSAFDESEVASLDEAHTEAQKTRHRTQTLTSAGADTGTGVGGDTEGGVDGERTSLDGGASEVGRARTTSGAKTKASGSHASRANSVVAGSRSRGSSVASGSEHGSMSDAYDGASSTHSSTKDPGGLKPVSEPKRRIEGESEAATSVYSHTTATGDTQTVSGSNISEVDLDDISLSGGELRRHQRQKRRAERRAERRQRREERQRLREQRREERRRKREEARIGYELHESGAQHIILAKGTFRLCDIYTLRDPADPTSTTFGPEWTTLNLNIPPPQYNPPDYVLEELERKKRERKKRKTLAKKVMFDYTPEPPECVVSLTFQIQHHERPSQLAAKKKEPTATKTARVTIGLPAMFDEDESDNPDDELGLLKGKHEVFAKALDEHPLPVPPPLPLTAEQLKEKKKRKKKGLSTDDDKDDNVSVGTLTETDAADELEDEILQKLGDHTVRTFQAAFRVCDRDNSGMIDQDEILTVLRILMIPASQIDEIVNMLQNLGGDNIEYDLVSLMRALAEIPDLEVPAHVDPTRILHVGEAFDFFDEDKSGAISVDELRSVLRQLGMEVSESDFRMMVKRLDSDESGDITWDEFVVEFVCNPEITVVSIDDIIMLTRTRSWMMPDLILKAAQIREATSAFSPIEMSSVLLLKRWRKDVHRVSKDVVEAGKAHLLSYDQHYKMAKLILKATVAVFFVSLVVGGIAVAVMKAKADEYDHHFDPLLHVPYRSDDSAYTKDVMVGVVVVCCLEMLVLNGVSLALSMRMSAHAGLHLYPPDGERAFVISAIARAALGVQYVTSLRAQPDPVASWSERVRSWVVNWYDILKYVVIGLCLPAVVRMVVRGFFPLLGMIVVPLLNSLFAAQRMRNARIAILGPNKVIDLTNALVGGIGKVNQVEGMLYCLAILNVTRIQTALVHPSQAIMIQHILKKLPNPSLVKLNPRVPGRKFLRTLRKYNAPFTRKRIILHVLALAMMTNTGFMIRKRRLLRRAVKACKHKAKKSDMKEFDRICKMAFSGDNIEPNVIQQLFNFEHVDDDLDEEGDGGAYEYMVKADDIDDGTSQSESFHSSDEYSSSGDDDDSDTHSDYGASGEEDEEDGNNGEESGLLGDAAASAAERGELQGKSSYRDQIRIEGESDEDKANNGSSSDEYV
eukprot:Rmarinus@m.3031